MPGTLNEKGWPQRQIAEAMGVSAAAVSQWMQRARNSGPTALCPQPSHGVPRRPLACLPELLHHGPEADGFRGYVWTRTRVAEVIRVTCGVVYHPTHVGLLLKTLCWSPQKLMRRLSSATKPPLRPGTTRYGR
jgi:transposase